MAGPSLGTLLIQRLDAVLGIALSQQGRLVQRAGAQAVYQPGEVQSPEQDTQARQHASRNPTDARATREAQARTTTTSTSTTPTGPQAPAAAAEQAPAQGSSSVLNLGPTARLILQVLAGANQASPMPIVARQPLFRPTAAGTPPPPHTLLVHQFANQLQHNLSQSGLFYESHLKAAISGRRPLEDLQREPQARTETSPQTLLRQQLETLADQTIHWRGESWPGADMDWRIRKEPYTPADDHSGNADDPEESAWQSRVQLDLPRLGTIIAEFRLLAQSMQLHLVAEPEQLPQLQEALPQLRDRLPGAEITLGRVAESTRTAQAPQSGHDGDDDGETTL